MATADIAARYRRYAHTRTHDSPLHTELALGVATDPALLALLNTLPRPRQQPELLFTCADHIAGTPTTFTQLRTTLLGQWHLIAPLMQQDHALADGSP